MGLEVTRFFFALKYRDPSFKKFFNPPTHKSRRTVVIGGWKTLQKTPKSLAALGLRTFQPPGKEKSENDRRTVRFSPKNRGRFVQQQARFGPIGVQKSHGSQLVYFVYYIDFFYRHAFTDSLSLASLPITRLPQEGMGPAAPATSSSFSPIHLTKSLRRRSHGPHP